jgi:hypothetical protein
MLQATPPTARIALASPVELEAVASDPLLDPRRIAERAKELFGTSTGVSSQIFSAFELKTAALTRSPSLPSNCAVEAKNGSCKLPSLPPMGEENSRKCDAPVLFVLKALVKNELDCMADADYGHCSTPAALPAGVDRQETDVAGVTAVGSRPRRVAFCSWDGSAAHPPIGRVAGSDIHRVKALESLMTVLRKVSELSARDVPALRQLVEFLHQDNESFAVAIARSMGPDYPVSFVRRSIQLYREDFVWTMQRLVSNGEMPPRPLHVEVRAMTWLGQFIRYQLRSLLNAAPTRGTKKDMGYEERCKAYSQIVDLVNLVSELPKKDQIGPVKECDLAVLVSLALETVYAFQGDDLLRSALPEAVYEEISTSSRTLYEEIQSPTWGSVRTPEFFGSVKKHVIELIQFLACRGAAQFLIDLLSNDIVNSEVTRRGGIGQLESCATAMLNFGLHIRVDEGNHAHLVLLSSVASFVAQESTWLLRTEKLAGECWDTLLGLKAKVSKLRTNDRVELVDLMKEQFNYAKSMPRVETIKPSILLKVFIEGELFQKKKWK